MCSHHSCLEIRLVNPCEKFAPFSDADIFRTPIWSHRTLAAVELFPRREDLAYMRARPQTERFDGLPQAAAELGQFVLHALRTGGEDSPRHQAVSLQSTQREREHPL